NDSAIPVRPATRSPSPPPVRPACPEVERGRGAAGSAASSDQRPPGVSDISHLLTRSGVGGNGKRTPARPPRVRRVSPFASPGLRPPGVRLRHDRSPLGPLADPTWLGRAVPSRRRVTFERGVAVTAYPTVGVPGVAESVDHEADVEPMRTVVIRVVRRAGG